MQKTARQVQKRVKIIEEIESVAAAINPQGGGRITDLTSKAYQLSEWYKLLVEQLLHILISVF